MKFYIITLFAFLSNIANAQVKDSIEAQDWSAGTYRGRVWVPTMAKIRNTSSSGSVGPSGSIQLSNGNGVFSSGGFYGTNVSGESTITLDNQSTTIPNLVRWGAGPGALSGALAGNLPAAYSGIGASAPNGFIIKGQDTGGVRIQATTGDVSIWNNNNSFRSFAFKNNGNLEAHYPKSADILDFDFYNLSENGYTRLKFSNFGELTFFGNGTGSVDVADLPGTVKLKSYKNLSLYSETGDIVLVTGNINSAKAIIKQNGNVGIGTANPSATLDVNGTGRFTGNVGIGVTSPTYALQVAGTGLFQTIILSNVSEYTDNAAAIAAGVPIGGVYRTGDALKIAH